MLYTRRNDDVNHLIDAQRSYSAVMTGHLSVSCTEDGLRTAQQNATKTVVYDEKVDFYY